MILQKAWMDDQLLQGISAVNLKKPFPVFLIIRSHSRFYGDLHPGFFEDLIQKTFQLIRLAQETGTLSLGCDSSRGASQVEIHFPVSVFIPEDMGCFHKILRIVGQDLRNHRKISVGFR